MLGSLEMDSNEILRAAKELNIPNFLGVFAADQIDSIKSKHLGTLIVNTEPSHLNGQHWISLCICEKEIFLYDPLSLDFHMSKYIRTFLIRMHRHFNFNTMKVQTNDSEMCGYHALVFCYIMSKGKCRHRFQSFLKSFQPYNVIKREQLSMNYYTIFKENESKSIV